MENKIFEKNLKYGKKARSGDPRIVKIKTEGSGIGILKTLIIVALIVAEFAAMLYVYLKFMMAFRWYMAVSFCVTLIMCVYVLSSKKNGLSKAVWILFLLLTFWIGYVVYLLSDERIFFAKPKKKYVGVFKNAEKYISEYEIPNANAAVLRDSEFLYKTGKFPTYVGSRVTYMSSGTQLFDDILERLKTAKKFIFIEFFIVTDGVLLTRMFDVLSKKAAEGVDVRIIYDDMGSHHTFSRRTKEKFKRAKIKIKPFNRLIPYLSVALNYRDHRKIVVCDGEVAWTGGCNLADEYINEKRMHGYWKDSGVCVEGRAVDSLTLTFLRQWEYLSLKREDYSNMLGVAQNFDNLSVVIPYADGLDFDYPIGKSVYENMVAAATEKIFIMTPYLVLDDAFAELLANKAQSGVDVRIILPGVPDKKFVYSVSRSNAEKLMDYGVKVYCMENSFVHSKIVLTENCAVVGSINMDLRSFYQQFESAVYSNDEKFRADILADFERTIADSKPIDQKTSYRKNLLNRVWTGFLQIFAPFM